MEFNLVEKLLGLTLLGTEWVLWLLLILSVVSVALMFERYIFFSRIKIDFPNFYEKLTQYMIRQEIDSAKVLCEQQSASLECQVALKGLNLLGKGKQAAEETMVSTIIGSRQILDRGLIVLGTLGSNAPFIGLFGTVLGIIKSFHDLSLNPAGGPSVVMAGISESLVATALGLMVAIPAVVAFNTFQRSVKKRIANSEAIMKMILANTPK